jgi:hypothetical protein
MELATVPLLSIDDLGIRKLARTALASLLLQQEESRVHVKEQLGHRAGL